MTDDEWAAIERPLRQAIKERTMQNAQTERPTLEPTDTLADVVYYLQKRIAAATDRARSPKLTQREQAGWIMVRSELLGMLHMLAPHVDADSD